MADQNISTMLRNNIKAQGTQVVATIAAVLPNGIDKTVSADKYFTALIPARTLVTNVYAVTTEMFNGGATFTVGTEDDDDCFFAGINGDTENSVVAMTKNTYYPVDTEVTIVPTYAADNTTGQLNIVFECYEPMVSTGMYTR
jgi:hypothetical protein